MNTKVIELCKNTNDPEWKNAPRSIWSSFVSCTYPAHPFHILCIFWTLHLFNVACLYSCLSHFLFYKVNLILLQKYLHNGGNLNAWISLNHNILLDQRVHFNRKSNWKIMRRACKIPIHASKNVMPSPVLCDSQLLLGPSRITQNPLPRPGL